MYNPGWNGDCEGGVTVPTTLGGMVMTVSEASLYCVYKPGWNGDDCERGVYCVYNPGWNGDDCERGVTVLCVQPWVEW